MFSASLRIVILALSLSFAATGESWAKSETSCIRRAMEALFPKSRVELVGSIGKEGAWSITPLADRPGYYRVELTSGKWAGEARSGAVIFDPNRIIEELGGQGLEDIGILREGSHSFIFADAGRLNGISRNRNAAVALSGAGHDDLKFLVKFYEGAPNSPELLERFASDMEWPLTSQGDLAIHDWTTHSMSPLIDNELLVHLQNQVREGANFRNFVLAHPEKYARILKSPDGIRSMNALMERYGYYLDNAMGFANNAYKAEVFKFWANDVKSTPTQLFQEFGGWSLKGGGPEFQGLAEEWRSALLAYQRERIPPVETTYVLTQEKILEVMRKKLGIRS